MINPIDMIPKEHFVAHGGRFGPKMSDAERCAVFALAKSGVKRDRLADAFGVNKRTIGHIINPNGLRYKDVRHKYAQLGHDEFMARYLTEDVAQKIAALPVEAPSGPTNPSQMNSRANRLAGFHKIEPSEGLRSYPREVEIKYLKADSAFDGAEAGWYFLDLTSTKNDEWLHFGDESRKSSSACLHHIKENLTDD